MSVFWLDPPPAEGELPARFPHPARVAVVPALDRAIAGLTAELDAHRGMLEGPGGGKMFGVLLVEERGTGRVGYLRAFSGMLGDAWHVDGFAPPVFDHAAREAFWPAGEAELAAIDRELAAFATGEEAIRARTALAALDAHHAAALAALTARHRANRDARRAARAALAPGDAAAAHALDQASRGDTAERRRVLAAMAEARAPLAAAARAVDERLAAATQRKAARSRELLARIWRCYAIPNARGEHASIEALFAPGAPPGGAADCAGPKLLAAAYRRGLRPIAMGELWWGAPPATGDRRAGQRYPACRGKCGVVLPWMLSGLDHEPEPLFGAGGVAGEEPRVVHEDAWLVVVDKPCGLLSVPGRSGLLSDSVLTRLRARGLDPHVVHRLDLDTSGLMLLAKDRATHAQLQRAFAERAIDKRYVALVAGDVTGDRGEIALPLRVDVDDRPRQIHDPVHGKAALTAWQVLGRGAGRTRVAFHPRTGRTHQLRVHAAHPLGLGAPIVGDRLYGDPDVRLMLHAEELRFAHPHTGASVVVARPAPF